MGKAREKEGRGYVWIDVWIDVWGISIDTISTEMQMQMQAFFNC